MSSGSVVRRNWSPSRVYFAAEVRIGSSLGAEARSGPGGVLFLEFCGFAQRHSGQREQERSLRPVCGELPESLVYLGVRPFVCYLSLDVGTTIIAAYIPVSLRVTTAQETAQVVAISVTFAVPVLRIPSNMAGRVASGGSFGIAHGLRSL